MKRSTLLCCLLLCAAAVVRAGEPPALFTEGNRLYQSGQYAKAAARYQQLIDSGYQVADLYLNAGNAYYKSNQTGMAVYSFEKALRLHPGDDGIERNLRLANARVDHNIETLPLLFFEKWWLQLQQLHSARGWAIGSILLFWLLLAVIGWRWISPGTYRPRWHIWGSAAAGVLFVFYLGMAYWVQQSAYHSDVAIVMQKAVKVKAAPDDGAKDMFEVREGMKLEVLDATSEYCKVQLADGKTGWMTVKGLKRL
ncbi:tetratricopeptide repeat protein [Chitinophaga lutea]